MTETKAKAQLAEHYGRILRAYVQTCDAQRELDGVFDGMYKLVPMIFRGKLFDSIISKLCAHSKKYAQVSSEFFDVLKELEFDTNPVFLDGDWVFVPHESPGQYCKTHFDTES